MPMWSAATRSILRAAGATPRKKLPPPTTMPICVPGGGHVRHFGRQFPDAPGVDPETGLAGQHLAAQLQQDAFVPRQANASLAAYLLAGRVADLEADETATR